MDRKFYKDKYFYEELNVSYIDYLFTCLLPFINDY